MRHVGKIDGVSVGITDHALQRMIEMGLSPDEIRAVILEPDERYESKKYPGGFCQSRGNYTLALQKVRKILVVKTVLYSSPLGWKQAELNGQVPETRKRKAKKKPRRRKRRA